MVYPAHENKDEVEQDAEEGTEEGKPTATIEEVEDEYYTYSKYECYRRTAKKIECVMLFRLWRLRPVSFRLHSVYSLFFRESLFPAYFSLGRLYESIRRLLSKVTFFSVYQLKEVENANLGHRRLLHTAKDA